MERHEFIGRIIRDGQIRYRILHYHQEQFVLCQLDTSRLNLQYCSAEAIYRTIRNHTAVIEDETDYKIMDFERLSEKQKLAFQKRKEIVMAIEKAYGPSFMELTGKTHKTSFCDICNRYEISPNAAWKYIRNYLQSGFNDCSLLDHRASNLNNRSKVYNYKKKPGRRYPDRPVRGVALTEEHLYNLSIGLNEFKSGREQTLKNAYISMRAKRYIQSVGPNGQYVFKPESEIPTYRQFVDYCNKRLTAEEKRVLKTSKSEERNDHRLLIGTSSSKANRPGAIVEVDALEMDCAIVSEYNQSQCVGRPILYMMIDCYSRAIVAFSLSFENNSMIGLTNLLLNLADNKKAFCAKYDIPLHDELYWPSNFIPNEIRCDRGSDFKSDLCSAVCQRLGINRTLVSGGSGSMKGVIERSFGQLQGQLRPDLEGKGLITKRHDSKHHQQAIYTLKEMTQFVISFIIAHNMKALTEYSPSKDMLEKLNGDPLTPLWLWTYGCNKMGTPRMIQPTQKNQFIYDLMTEETAKLSRRGLFINGLYYYIPDDEKMRHRVLALLDKKEDIVVRIDPRYVGAIYYYRDNTLYRAPINAELSGDEEYANMTLLESEKFYEEKKKREAKEKAYNLDVDTAHHIIRKQIGEQKKPSGVSNTKNMRDARAKEKARKNKENRLENHFEESYIGLSDIPKTLPTESKILPTTQKNKPKDIGEAIAQFNEWDEEDFDDV